MNVNESIVAIVWHVPRHIDDFSVILVSGNEISKFEKVLNRHSASLSIPSGDNEGF